MRADSIAHPVSLAVLAVPLAFTMFTLFFFGRVSDVNTLGSAICSTFCSAQPHSFPPCSDLNSTDCTEAPWSKCVNSSSILGRQFYSVSSQVFEPVTNVHSDLLCSLSRSLFYLLFYHPLSVVLCAQSLFYSAPISVLLGVIAPISVLLGVLLAGVRACGGVRNGVSTAR